LKAKHDGEWEWRGTVLKMGINLTMHLVCPFVYYYFD